MILRILKCSSLHFCINYIKMEPVSLKTHMIVTRGASPNYGVLFTLIFLAGKEEKYPIISKWSFNLGAGGRSQALWETGRPWSRASASAPYQCTLMYWSERVLLPCGNTVSSDCLLYAVQHNGHQNMKITRSRKDEILKYILWCPLVKRPTYVFCLFVLSPTCFYEFLHVSLRFQSRSKFDFSSVPLLLESGPHSVLPPLAI